VAQQWVTEFIKSFTEVHNKDIGLFHLINVFANIIHKFNELTLTRSGLSEAMLEWILDAMFISTYL